MIKFIIPKWMLIMAVMLPLIADSHDVHSSKFNNSPLFINPAMTANFRGNFRFGLIYRNQRSIWVPYKIYSVFGDSKIKFSSMNRTCFGVAIMAYKNNAGDGILQNSLGSISFSATQGFSRFNTFRVSTGFSTGFVNRCVNLTQFVFDVQWNRLYFDPNQSNNEPFTSTSVFAFDFIFGLLIVYDILYNMRAYSGASISHINRPKSTFYNDGNRINRNLIVQGNITLLR